MDFKIVQIKDEPVDLGDFLDTTVVKEELDINEIAPKIETDILVKEEIIEFEHPEDEICIPIQQYHDANLPTINSEYETIDISNDNNDSQYYLSSSADIKPDIEQLFLEQLRKNNYIQNEDTEDNQNILNCNEKIKSEGSVIDFEIQNREFKRIKLEPKDNYDAENVTFNYKSLENVIKKEEIETDSENEPLYIQDSDFDSGIEIKPEYSFESSEERINSKNIDLRNATNFQQIKPIIESCIRTRSVNIGQQNLNNVNVTQNYAVGNISNNSKLINFPAFINIPKGNKIQCSGYVVNPTTTQNKKFKILTNNLKGLKIVKLHPNTKIVKIPKVLAPQFVPSVGTRIQRSNSENKTVYLNLKPLPTTKLLSNNGTQESFALSNKIITLQPKLPIMHAKHISAHKEMEKNLPAQVDCQSQNNSNIIIDKSSFEELLSEASKKADKSNSKLYVRKNVLSIAESFESNKELIGDMIKQIKEVETKMNCTGVTSLVDITEDADEPLNAVDKYKRNMLLVPKKNGSNNPKKEVETTSQNSTDTEIKPPDVMLLPVKTKFDPELIQAKKEFKNYRFTWLCPHCPRKYEQKHAFRGHLVGSHGLCKEEFDKLLIEVKSYHATSRGFDINRYKRFKEQREKMLSSETQNQLNQSNMEDINGPAILRPKSQSQHICSKCGRQCSSKTMLNDHISSNCSREPQYPCPECPKKFFSYSTLTCHITIHTGELPFKCDYCHKRFRTRGQVTVHHRTHTGERPFACKVCTQSFTHRETLISHLSRHIGMKRYKCYACNKQFSCISGLKTHREIRPDTCGKVKFNPRALGPRVRVVRGNIIFEPQPDINPYLRSDDPNEIPEVQNQQEE